MPGQIAACESLRNLPYYEKRWAETHQLRARLSLGLAALGWDVVPGCANFLLCHLPDSQPDASSMIAACRTHGLFIRDVKNMGSCFDARTLRIAVKGPETIDAMLQILRSMLAEPSSARTTVRR